MTTKSVVVCDDDQTLITIIRVFLTKQGFQVYSAENGNAAVKMIKSAKPQLLFLDIDMPEKNGFEVLEELRTAGLGKLYKIVISAHEDKASRDRALALGADEVWVKPFNAAKLLTSVDALIKQGKI